MPRKKIVNSLEDMNVENANSLHDMESDDIVLKNLAKKLLKLPKKLWKRWISAEGLMLPEERRETFTDMKAMREWKMMKMMTSSWRNSFVMRTSRS